MGWYIERHDITGTKRKISYMMQGSLAERLRILRAREGLTLTEASERIGITRHTLSSLERGGQEPHYPTLAKIAKGYGVPVEGLLEEPVLAGKAEAPDQGQPEGSAKTLEEFEQTLAHVLEPGRVEALHEQQAGNRFLSSQGRPQDRVVDPPEAEIGKRYLEAFTPDEQPMAFAEVAIGRERFARDKANLQEALTRAEKLLREHGEKIAQLEQENAQLKAKGERESIRR